MITLTVGRHIQKSGRINRGVIDQGAKYGAQMTERYFPGRYFPGRICRGAFVGAQLSRALLTRHVPPHSVREHDRNFDYDSINVRLFHIDWFAAFNSCINVNDLLRVFSQIITNIIAECAPFKRKRRHYTYHLPYYIRHAIACV